MGAKINPFVATFNHDNLSVRETRRPPATVKAQVPSPEIKIESHFDRPASDHLPLSLSVPFGLLKPSQQKGAGLTAPQWAAKLDTSARAGEAAISLLKTNPAAEGARAKLGEAIHSHAGTIQLLAEELVADPKLTRSMREVAGRAREQNLWGGAVTETKADVLAPEVVEQGRLFNDAVACLRKLVTSQLRFDPAQSKFAETLGRSEAVAAELEAAASVTPARPMFPPTATTRPTRRRTSRGCAESSSSSLGRSRRQSMPRSLPCSRRPSTPMPCWVSFAASSTR